MHPAQPEVISLRNANGLQADILPVGATIQRLIVPDRDGVAEDVVLGYDSPKHYQVPATWASPCPLCCLTLPGLHKFTALRTVP
jgi:galactose mutarotase-like enzyme